MNAQQVQSPLQLEAKKVKNILIRYCGNKKLRFYDGYAHPEKAYISKYFPKYYYSLKIDMTPQNPVLSKIKKIKHLKSFCGNFHDRIPQVKWFKILQGNKKELEELPRALVSRAGKSFWAKTYIHATKFFWITKFQLSTLPFEWTCSRDFYEMWEVYSKQLRSMRRLKCFELENIYLTIGPNLLKPLFKKLNKMPRLLQESEVVEFHFDWDFLDETFLRQNKKIIENMTNLNIPSISSYDFSISQILPQVCKNLRSLSLEFDTSSETKSYCSQKLNQFTNLQSLTISWLTRSASLFWSSFIVPASLERLTLNFWTTNFINVDLWEGIPALDTLKLFVFCKSEKDVEKASRLITGLLKKISKLTSFKCSFKLRKEYEEESWRYQPFSVEEVPHLYESLKKIKLEYDEFKSFFCLDLGFLKSFKNMQEIEFKGDHCYLENIGDAVSLLEGNARHGEMLTLKLENTIINFQKDLKDLLMNISIVKNSQTKVKVILALSFSMQAGDDEIEYLDNFCKVLESNVVKGLEISLCLIPSDCPYWQNEKMIEVERVLSLYPGLRNITFQVIYLEETLEYIGKDGEKEQLFVTPSY